MSKKEAEYNAYRIDALEKRLERIEQALDDMKKNNINTELLNIVLGLVRPAPVAATPSVPVVADAPTAAAEDPKQTISPFLFARRKTIV